VLWGGVMVLLFSRFGWEHTLTQMGWFFTKAALLTFGGAYAVLPYVYQGGVEQYQWLPVHRLSRRSLRRSSSMARSCRKRASTLDC